VDSSGLVLCASNDEHTIVEPLAPPEGAKPGELISFEGIEMSPDAVLNSKKFRKILKKLATSESDPPQAIYMDIPFMTSAGVVTVPSLKKANVK
jgi:aminoacyl tRNA synthase complex-interacting multifunctional protein 1